MLTPSQIESRIAEARQFIEPPQNRRERQLRKMLMAIEADIPDEVVAEPPPRPPVAAPPPASTLLPHDPVNLDRTPNLVLKDRRIVAQRASAIHANDGVRTTLNLENIEIDVRDGSTPEGWSTYALMTTDCTDATLKRVRVNSKGYMLRGRYHKWRSEDCQWQGAHNWRMVATSDLESARDTWDGPGRIILGGSPGTAGQQSGEFHNAIFRDGRMSTPSMEIWDRTHDVQFIGMDFAAMGHISVSLGARNIYFIGCTNLPRITGGGAAAAQVM